MSPLIFLSYMFATIGHVCHKISVRTGKAENLKLQTLIARDDVLISMGQASANPTQVQMIWYTERFMIDSREWKLWLEHVSSYS